ncbi:MAG: polyphosphate kinase 2 [Bacteriovoracaceae bacterium]|nr:polyphosphate kinase 2 [Bacteriovoracaceae bacterium]
MGDKTFSDLEQCQVELVKLQYHVRESDEKILIMFEGRDTAGKGGGILTFARHLNPRYIKIVALTKPTELERGQWYFQRHLVHLPCPGQIVFFDRSWYNRAVIEPALGFCSKLEHEQFLEQVVNLENMLIQSGIHIFKFWFSIKPETQKLRIKDRQINPLKTWKLSPVDQLAQEKWKVYTRFKEKMFLKTSSEVSPWYVIDGNDKQIARMEAIKLVCSQFEYPDKNEELIGSADTSVIKKITSPESFDKYFGKDSDDSIY